MIRRVLVLVVLLALVAAPAWALSTGFEEGLGLDGQTIGSTYTGVTFTAGASAQEWVYSDVTTGLYNASSWPSGTQYGSGEFWMNDNVSVWTGLIGSDGRIEFDAGDGTFLQINYGSATTLYLDAYNSSDALIDSDSQPANLRYSDGNSSGPGTLRVDAPLGETIKYVILHDSGNLWTADNLVTNDTGAGVVPEPGTIALLSMGAAALLPFRRRRLRR